ncbi:GNAT family N-acetyltransferase [Arcanobacterium haemolyticum]|nr:GNAT family N-acetyltransferase [Arcanobacterium haemolyticum]
MLPVELTTERLVLSVPTFSDVDAITQMCQDPANQKWTTIPSPYVRADAESYVAGFVDPGWEDDSLFSWVLRTKENDEVVGQISLRAADRAIGYMLSPLARGFGYMGEAVQAVLDFAFDELTWDRVRWACEIHDDVNWASARVAWQAGFTFEGRLRGALQNKGTFYDAFVGSISRGDPRTPQHAWPGPDGRHPEIGDSRRPEDLVRVFHKTYGLPIIEGEPDADRERVHMRLSLVAEEAGELVGAVYGKRAQEIMTEAFARAREADDGTRDTVEVADALGDLVYVAYGMALELGIPMRDVLAEIQASNLSKLGEDGKPIYREDGKVLKGPNFFAPDIKRILGL